MSSSARSGRLREIAVPFVAAAPAGARVRTRLRVSAQDEAVLWTVGRHLGSLAGKDLAARCAQGHLDAKGRNESRAGRKRALTAASSSRWAGAITRTSEDAYQRAEKNLKGERASLQARIRRIEARLAVPAGSKAGRVRGYATTAERYAKAIRLKALRARLARVRERLEEGRMPVVRGREGTAPQAEQPRRCRAHRGPVAPRLGVGQAVPDRGRRSGQAVGKRDDQGQPR